MTSLPSIAKTTVDTIIVIAIAIYLIAAPLAWYDILYGDHMEMMRELYCQ